MKTGWLILAVAALLGTTAFAVRYAAGRAQVAECASCCMPPADAHHALAWMKSDFNLDDAEFDKVCALHEAYLPKCDAMCARMAEAGAKLTGVLRDGAGMTPQAEAELRAYEALRAECTHAMMRHLTETAAVMKPEARRAFLDRVLPHLLSTHQHLTEITQ